METYICQKAFLITTQGVDHYVSDIEISAPTARISSLFSRIESEINKAKKATEKAVLEVLAKAEDKESLLNAAQKMSESDDSEKVEPTEQEKIDSVLEQLKSEDVNISVCYSALKDILCHKKNGATMKSESGSFKLETGHWEDIPMKEVKQLLGFYIVNFIDS